MFNLEFVSRGVSVNVKLKDKLCCFIDDSGTGKSFLFTIIYEYCKENGIPIALLNYTATDFGDEAIINSCKNKSVVIFDNADLYLSNNIISSVTADVVIMSIKSVEKYRFNDYGEYSVESSRYEIKTRRW
jgi:ABC-type polar amino acid transport system ATPase subunit